MPTYSSHSQNTPAEWTGARSLMQKWLARQCATESLLNLAGTGFFLVFGLAALIFTTCVAAGLVFVILVELNAVLSFLASQFP